MSLFTNIPLNEAIDIVCNYVYQQHSPPKYSKETLKKLHQIATGGYFLHGEKLCCQFDGVTMGSPLGPTLANFFGLIWKISLRVSKTYLCLYITLDM